MVVAENPEGSGVVSARTFAVAAAAAGASVALDVGRLVFHVGGARATRYLSDLAGIGAVTVAAVACCLARQRSEGRSRRAFSFLFASTLMFALGEYTWGFYELALRRQVPFPSVADLGFLAGYPLAAAATISFPAVPLRLSSPLRTVLDAVIITMSLFYLGWALVLGPTYRAAGGSPLERATGLAYPVADILIVSILLVVFTRVGRSGRAPLVLLGAGLASLAISDSAFSVLTLHNAYATGAVTDAGWDLGYLLIALAALRPTAIRPAERRIADRPWMSQAIPYGAAVVVVATAAVEQLVNHALEPVLFWGTLAIIVLVVARQLVSIAENNALTRNLEAQVAEREELIRRAFHDPLTGLANRTLLRDRLKHALDRAARNRRAVDVLYCDIDNFKSANDRYGHHIGDIVLAGFAQRLLGTVRRGDTVSRLGGDEFAIVIEDGDGERVARRILEELEVPFDLEGMSWISIGASIGIASNSSASDPDDLIRCADIAMYAAKRRGKQRYEVYEPSMLGLGEPPALGVG
jgi:diguanylate cyclase (GGDEF)-like protein